MGITSLKRFSKAGKKEILSFHGMGKASILKLKEALSGIRMKLKD